MAYSVIIVEDEVAVSQLLAQYLLFPQTQDTVRQGQYQVVGCAGSIKVATGLLKALQPDLILLDIYLPDGSGLELLQQVRKQGLKSDVMLITAAKEVTILEQAMQLGVCDFLVKPLMLKRLDQALARFEARQHCLSVAEEVTQSIADTLFGGDKQSSNQAPVRLPKGVDALTLDKIRCVFTEHPKQSYTAQQMGALVGMSRSTARRYLEYMLAIDELIVDQNYGAIGRPERSYRFITFNKS
ncbi:MULTISPECIES: response regulator [Shewanella]|uniref:Transcriptional regulatory protein n=1 Tax=Shewanella indica TaxID=768528 RepID=A0ABU4QGN5_9GAMM|nr:MULTISPECIES: response regulator [Shewanella]MDX6018006.1 response regulator [Shewanella indica]NDO76550.1 response regulator [Shewanella sp. SE1]